MEYVSKDSKKIGENEVDDRIISMFQTMKCNGLEDLSIDYVINWCDKLDSNGYVMSDDYSMLYKSSANLKMLKEGYYMNYLMMQYMLTH